MNAELMIESKPRTQGTLNDSPRIGYVVKRYPRFSETFIVNELLAHEAAGTEVEIFALRHSNDTHFQDAISRVRAPVTYLAHTGLKAKDIWETMREFSVWPVRLSAGLSSAWHADVVDVYQGMLLAQEVMNRGIEHLHAHFATSPTTVARIAAHLAGIGFSFTAHAKDIFHDDVVPENLIAKLNDADAVVTVSDYNLEHLRKLSLQSDPKIVRIYNGLDLETFDFQRPVDRAPLVVAVGRLVEKKGFKYLVDACASMRDDGREFECRIIGTGPLEADLRSQISQLDLNDRVTLTGALPQQEMRKVMRTAAVHAAPCVVGEDGNRDGLPTTLLEAMALGTPNISTDVTGIPEAIRHNETGLVVPQHDSKQLAGAVGALLDHPDIGVRLALAARCLIEDQFDIAKSTRSLRELFTVVARERAAKEFE